MSVIEVSHQLAEQLHGIAREKGIAVDTLIQEMIDTYQHQRGEENFDAELERIMQKHAGLLDRLAKS